MARGDDDYRLLPIVDAMSAVNQRVNVVGVVVETNLPRRSKGTDCFCTVKIIDQSYSSPGLLISCFERSMEKLPCVESAGDIIFFSRILMQSHCGEVNASFNKTYSTFAIFEGKHGTQLLPYQASAKFHHRDQDNKFLVCLRKWLLDHQLNEGISLLGLKEYLHVKELRVGEHLTLLCKVLHVCKFSENKWMAFIWDGTDAPPVTMQAKHENEFEKPPPLQLEPFPLPRDVLLNFPTIGTIVRMVMENDNQCLGLLKCDRWVKLINVTCDHHAGLWQCMLMSFSKLQYLPNTEPVISQSERNYEERISLSRRIPTSCFPGCSFITETDCRKMPIVTLMDVITYPEVTCKFRCAVRVISFFPFQTEEFCSPQGTYRLTLTLEDSTARIYAFLYAEDAEKFFGGYPSDEALKRKRNALLGVSGCSSEEEILCAPRNPPWVQCCIKSYYIDKQNNWGNRKYRIFATKVIVD